MLYCQYYQGKIKKEECSFFVAILRSFEHLSFDRTFDKNENIFEFFVPTYNEEAFLKIINHFIKLGIITDFKKSENRLLDPNEEV